MPTQQIQIIIRHLSQTGFDSLSIKSCFQALHPTPRSFALVVLSLWPRMRRSPRTKGRRQPGRGRAWGSSSPPSLSRARWRGAASSCCQVTTAATTTTTTTTVYCVTSCPDQHRPGWHRSHPLLHHQWGLRGHEAGAVLAYGGGQVPCCHNDTR